MSNRIRAFSTALIATDPAKLPDSIEWMPAGTHSICCSRDGESAEISVIVEESIVPVLNEQLQAARTLAEAGKASRPYIDFDHASGEAAAIPTEFFWEDGIRLRVEWTTAGAAAVSGRVYSYFSPEFFADKSGKVTAIPEVGPIGALVNTPAFQGIERLAATIKFPTMNNIAKALGLAETATEAEILAKIAELSGAATEKTIECADLKAALELKAKEAADLVRASAVAEVERHAASAEVPEAVRPMIVEAIIKNATEGRKILAAFKPAKPAPGAAPFKSGSAAEDTSDAAILDKFNSMPEGKEKDLYQRANGSALLRAYRAK